VASHSPLDRPFGTSFGTPLRSYSGLLRVRPAANPVETGSQAPLVPPFSTLSRAKTRAPHGAPRPTCRLEEAVTPGPVPPTRAPTGQVSPPMSPRGTAPVGPHLSLLGVEPIPTSGEGRRNRLARRSARAPRLLPPDLPDRRNAGSRRSGERGSGEASSRGSRFPCHSPCRR
jgi:hypothetical protein